MTVTQALGRVAGKLCGAQSACQAWACPPPCVASRTTQDAQASPSVFSGWKFNGKPLVLSLGYFPSSVCGFVGAPEDHQSSV